MSESARTSNLKETFEIAWPSVTESVLIVLAGMVDTYMVSTLGKASVAGVGVTNQPKYFAYTMFYALNTAIASLCARRLGEKRRKDANGMFLTALYFVFVVSVLLGLLCVIFAEPILLLFGANPDTLPMADRVLEGDFRNVVLLLLDAMGMSILEKHLETAPDDAGPHDQQDADCHQDQKHSHGDNRCYVTVAKDQHGDENRNNRDHTQDDPGHQQGRIRLAVFFPAVFYHAVNTVSRVDLFCFQIFKLLSRKTGRNEQGYRPADQQEHHDQAEPRGCLFRKRQHPGFLQGRGDNEHDRRQDAHHHAKRNPS